MADVTNFNNFSFGFFNSLNGDRKYEAKDFATIFEGIILPGVYESIGDRFLVKESSLPDNKVQILEGRAWLDNFWIKNAAINTITLPDPDLVLDRIDAVCIEINEANETSELGTPGRSVSFIVVKGEAASNPIRPTLQNDEEVHQYALSYVYRHNGRDATVVQADITNVVGQTELPYVTCPLTAHDISDMVAQWQAQFKNWMDLEELEFKDWIQLNKDILDSHIGGELIDSLATRLTTIEANIVEIKDELGDIGGLIGGDE